MLTNLYVSITVTMAMLLRGFLASRDNCIKVCVVITAAMAMMLKDFGPYWKIFIIVCLLL